MDLITLIVNFIINFAINNQLMPLVKDNQVFLILKLDIQLINNFNYYHSTLYKK